MSCGGTVSSSLFLFFNFFKFLSVLYIYKVDCLMDHKLYFNRLTLNMYASYIFTEMTLFNLLSNYIFYFFSRCKFSSFLEFLLRRIVKMSLRLCMCSAND